MPLISSHYGGASPDQGWGPCHIGARFSREEIKVVWCEGWSDSRNREEWLLRVCSRLEEGAAKGEERRVRMERTIRPLDRTPPGNLLNPSPPLERAGIKLRSFATHTKRKRIRISSRFRQSAAIRFAILTGRGRKTLEPPEVISRKIYNNHSARRTTNIQQRINRWSSAGFFFSLLSSPFSSRVSRI